MFRPEGWAGVGIGTQNQKKKWVGTRVFGRKTAVGALKKPRNRVGVKERDAGKRTS
jgi:hypothetical protein